MMDIGQQPTEASWDHVPRTAFSFFWCNPAFGPLALHWAEQVVEGFAPIAPRGKCIMHALSQCVASPGAITRSQEAQLRHAAFLSRYRGLFSPGLITIDGAPSASPADRGGIFTPLRARVSPDRSHRSRWPGAAHSRMI
ncbi:hypothetical protein C2E23DRAFT_241424 [Lenzites betulinus]|nr:hypothetical protein C2E23DRAFT_241424 [Lenzites betulinus]